MIHNVLVVVQRGRVKLRVHVQNIMGVMDMEDKDIDNMVSVDLILGLPRDDNPIYKDDKEEIADSKNLVRGKERKG